MEPAPAAAAADDGDLFDSLLKVLTDDSFLLVLNPGQVLLDPNFVNFERLARITVVNKSIEATLGDEDEIPKVLYKDSNGNDLVYCFVSGQADKDNWNRWLIREAKYRRKFLG